MGHVASFRWRAYCITSRKTLQVVFTDGAASARGSGGSCAGVGVYFGDGDPRNISEPLNDPVQTNQRAELTAIKRALEVSSRHRPLEVHSDSRFAVEGLTELYSKWERDGWKNSRGKPVADQDLLKQIMAAVKRRGASVTFKHVHGHSGVVGNQRAHQLARHCV